MNNFKRTLIAMLLASAVTACGSAEESSARYLESGIELYEAGDYDKARLEFRNAIQINPLEAEGYYHLGLLDERAQNWRGMYSNMTTVESLNPNHVGAIIKLGQIELLSGQFDKAEERANKALGFEPDNTEAILLLATAYIKQERFDEAEKQIDKALAVDPSNMEALSANIMMLKEMGRYDAALRGVDQALALHPDAMPLKLIKLEIFNSKQDYAGMETLYRELATDFPNESWVAVSLARLFNNQNRYEDAQKVLEDYLKNNPSDTDVMLSHVTLVQTRDSGAAIALLDQYIAQNPDKETLRFAKIELLQQTGNTADMRAELQAIAAAQPESESGLRAKASLAGFEASEGNFENAEKIVDEILAISSDHEQALTLKSKLLLTRNDYDAAISNLRIVTRNNPDADEALVLIAQAYARTGAVQLAESSFRRALTVNPQNAEAALAVASLSMQNDDLDRAEAALQTALTGQNANNEELLQALTQIRLMRRDWAGAGQSLEVLGRQGTSSAINHLLSAQMYQGLADNTLALAEYEKALEIDPALTQALEGLTTIHMQLNQEQQAIDYLEQYIAKYPEQLNGYTVLANFYRQKENFTDAVIVTEEGLVKNPQWAGGYGLLASLYTSLGDQDKVIETYERGVAALPDNNMLSMQLASSYEQIGNYEKARDLYEKVLTRNPGEDIAANNLASLLSDQFESPENLQRALTMVNHFKNSEQPYFVDTYGWVHFKLGNYEEARPALEKAVQGAPEVAIFHYHLARLYLALGLSNQAAEARRTAERLANEQRDEAVLNKLAAELD